MAEKRVCFGEFELDFGHFLLYRKGQNGSTGRPAAAITDASG